MSCEYCGQNCPPPFNQSTGKSTGFSRKYYTNAALEATRERFEETGRYCFEVKRNPCPINGPGRRAKRKVK